MIINDIFKNRNSRRQMENVIAIQGNRKIINCSIKVVAEGFINVSICLKIFRLLDALIRPSISSKDKKRSFKEL